MKFFAKTFEELTTDELYEILKSRSEIFLLEQRIICQDMDDVDRRSLHCFFRDDNRIAAYLRAFSSKDDTVTVGRVLTLEHGKGLGAELMKISLEKIKNHFGNKKICVHAQKQAEKFYEKTGFVTVSGEYLLEGIPHVTMEMDIWREDLRI